MANTFKTITKADISNSTSTPTTVYTVPSGATCVVLGILCVNKVSSSVKVTLLLESDTANTGGGTNANITLAKDILLPSGSSLEFMAGQKYIMQTTDVLKAYSDSSSSVDVSFNYMEIT